MVPKTDSWCENRVHQLQIVWERDNLKYRHGTTIGVQCSVATDTL